MACYNNWFCENQLDSATGPEAQDEMHQSEFWALFETSHNGEGEQSYWSPFAHGLQQGDEAALPNHSPSACGLRQDNEFEFPDHSYPTTNGAQQGFTEPAGPAGTG